MAPKFESRLFVEGAPLSVVQNLLTAIDPQLLTDHTLMVLFHDLSNQYPIEELPRRLLDVIVDFFPDTEAEEEPDENDLTH